MRNLRLAGCSGALRLTAMLNGWVRGPVPIGRMAVNADWLIGVAADSDQPREGLLLWLRTSDGETYLTLDGERQAYPTAERIRAATIARFSGCCPCCSATATANGVDAAMANYTSGLVQVAGRPGVDEDGARVIRFALEHREDCPCAPRMIDRDMRAALN